MKKITYLLFIVFAVAGFTSCQSKTQKLIVKKWDCVQVENLSPVDLHYATKEDSANATKFETALKALSWTFNSNGSYNCSTINGMITVQGTYEISSDEKTLTCTSSSGNNSNTYTITSIEDFGMILTSTSIGASAPLIMHFSPH
ncbi:MAG: hypothetical protein WDM90_22705 [Ferruginibacter sp.]